MVSIVLIEDYADIRESTAEILELEGYQVTTAKNGKEGLDHILSSPPDLIICDMRMPEMDGLTLLGILGNSADLKRVPFIFFSAKSEKADINLGIEAGADEYLTKPFELQDLLGAVQRCLFKGKVS
ncbi:response regulator [Maribacter sp. ACAM166]|uniref:response regulator n=1 Tax=Maribacter sp. ACAM166 TaxID=2508996 RepID=UPI0010FF0265|nr:response regulator [Maribacter sp. ACAM166]TLP81794.1 response regulator [Maribacter sp. ACAM166]